MSYLLTVNCGYICNNQNVKKLKTDNYFQMITIKFIQHLLVPSLTGKQLR